MTTLEPLALARPILKNDPLKVWGFTIWKATWSRKRLSNQFSSSFAWSRQRRCSTPESKLRARSGAKRGLPRKNGEGLKDSTKLGSLTPSPKLNFSLVVPRVDRKSTRLNSSHSQISYAVFCLKKKKNYGRRYRRWRCI